MFTKTITSHETSLTAFLHYLKVGPAAPLPAKEGWSDLIRRTTTPGAACQVTEETYDYFLDVLPPRWMGREGFAFGEGCDHLRLFWQGPGGTFFSRQLTAEENVTFCRLAGIGLTSG
jgi:hypothetical protein